ncbi:ECF transporter S component [Nesterenkonia sp. E16_7]|uniref:ECF transporter S component n=1 Tax=unclassified Nesterenkonia TaxID=2629769 RepID=UPI001A92CC61|nr:MULTISPECIES: ECF transporter S component [unclassified Nesterenkonia]MBO0594922.1 ECF transporter S component [Nesterenkonia sp. E16_10]MBO0599858.1 ECF transporter S component [Nesterenkonia sp. E16_7]
MTHTDPHSGQGSVTAADPGETPKTRTKNTGTPKTRHTDRAGNHLRPAPPLWSVLALTAGAAVIVGTYLWVLTSQPATLGADLGHTTLGVMVGYLLGAALIAAGTLPRIPRSVLALMPVMIALNIATGQIVGMSPIPLYLDSLGTVIIGVIAGPAAGALTGILTNVIWGVTINPTVIAFTAGSAFIGAAAGWAARLGGFRRIWWAVLAGALAGIPTGLIATPVAAFIYGGGLGVGTGSIVAALQGAGASMLGAATIQGLGSDIADKAIIFALAFLVIAALPNRLRSRFPFTEHSSVKRAGMKRTGAERATPHTAGSSHAAAPSH